MKRVLSIIIFAIIFFAIMKAEDANNSEGVRLLEEAILRAAIQSYAIEGQFPSDINHIIENFSIHIDKRKFFVHYEFFAANILPHVRVFAL